MVYGWECYSYGAAYKLEWWFGKCSRDWKWRWSCGYESRQLLHACSSSDVVDADDGCADVSMRQWPKLVVLFCIFHVFWDIKMHGKVLAAWLDKLVYWYVFSLYLWADFIQVDFHLHILLDFKVVVSWQSSEQIRGGKGWNWFHWIQSEVHSSRFSIFKFMGCCGWKENCQGNHTPSNGRDQVLLISCQLSWLLLVGP